MDLYYWYIYLIVCTTRSAAHVLLDFGYGLTEDAGIVGKG